ncbi:MAG: metallophosphoesterase, partial [Gammaproteobacteria bacterium]
MHHLSQLKNPASIWVVVVFIALAVLVANEAGAADSESQVRNAWVQVLPPDRGVVRAITVGKRCPLVRFDNHLLRMHVRARPNSDFDVTTCELAIPKGTQRIVVAGRKLKPVSRNPQRIAIVGDTGCRMKAGNALDDGFQDCGNADDWEFAKVANRVAEWKPDLIIQLGDYIYREQECPADCGNCQGSPFNSPGMRMETWNTEFFDPGSPMLEAAPLVLVRGDHEKCERAGRGYFRFLEPSKRKSCTDFSAPYSLAFEDLQLVVMDTVQAEDTSLSPEVVVDR